MVFMETFLEIAEYGGVPDRDRIYYLDSCFTGQAANWWTIQKFANFTEAKNAFAAKFRVKEAQACFRENLFIVKYKASTEASMHRLHKQDIQRC